MIAQADSRKWMACLYNSFLFMEAKIMKMAKKLLALVLTGVMALSMLTGCALSDKVKAEAIEDALNSNGVQGSTVDVNYKYNKDLNDKAEKVWTDASLMNKKVSAETTTLTKAVIGTKNYGYVVVKVPEDAKKNLSWVTSAKTVDTALNNKIDTWENKDTTGKVKNYAAQNANPASKVKFGMKFIDNGEKGDKKVEYVIVVFETNGAIS
jgi:hypothetical protein